MLKILVFIFLSLNTILYSEEGVCIGGEKCTCICTKHKNRYYEQFKKQGVIFAKLVCGCPDGGCGKCSSSKDSGELKEEILELKFKKSNDSAKATLLP